MANCRDDAACAARGGMTKQEVQAAVFERDGGACTECGMTDEQHVAKYGRALDVHRLKPATMYTVTGCVLLCRSCHGDKPKKSPDEVDPEYPKGRGRFVRLSDEDHLMLSMLAKMNDRTLTAELHIALREYFRKHGKAN